MADMADVDPHDRTPPRRRPNVAYWFGVLVALLGLLALAEAAYFIARAEGATATVIHPTGPNVGFTDARGESHTVRVESRFEWVEGQQVPVLFMPDDPARARLAAFSELWLPPLMVLLLGVGIVLLQSAWAQRIPSRPVAKHETPRGGFRLSIETHQRLEALSLPLGSFGVIALIWLVLALFFPNAPAGAFALAVIVGIVTLAVVRHLFRNVIAAACPNCGGKAFPTTSDSRRIAYHCRSCGHHVVTGEEE